MLLLIPAPSVGKNGKIKEVIMYTITNYKTKKALMEAVKNGDEVYTYQPGGIFPAEKNGKVYLEGPHYPAPHTWYASAEIVDGKVVKVK